MIILPQERRNIVTVSREVMASRQSPDCVASERMRQRDIQSDIEEAVQIAAGRSLPVGVGGVLRKGFQEE